MKLVSGGAGGTALSRTLFLMGIFALSNAGFWLPYLASLMDGLVLGHVTPDYVNRDFVNYWMSGRLALSGETDLLFRLHDYQSALEATLGLPGLEPRHWSYPPHLLLLTAPLGLMPFGVAYVVFQFATAAFFACSVRAVLKEQEITDAGRSLALTLALLLVPFALFEFGAGQNGFLFGGAILYGLAFRKSRPFVAGLMLAVLTMKPQLGVLFPVLLLMERNYAAIVWTVVCTGLLLGLTTLCFGLPVWQGFLQTTLDNQTSVALEGTGVFLKMMPTWFAAFRAVGLGADLAMLGHFMIALPVLALCIAAMWKAPDAGTRTRLLVYATFLVTPYGFTYDLGPVLAVAAMAFAARMTRREGNAGWVEPAGAALLFAMPLWMPPLGLGAAATLVAPLVLTLLFLREAAGVSEVAAVLSRLDRRGRVLS